MRLYRTSKLHGGDVWTGTQADAKRAGKEHASGWEEVEVPTDKAGLMEFLNGLVAVYPPLLVVEPTPVDAFPDIPGLRVIVGEPIAPEPQHPTIRNAAAPGYSSPCNAQTTIQRIDATMMARAIKTMDDSRSIGTLLTAMTERLLELGGVSDG